jgi:group I intron endonuclease
VNLTYRFNIAGRCQNEVYVNQVKVGIIYRITNIINGKIYIGQTIQSLKRRFQHHCRSDGKMPFQRAIQKYGKENFVTEELCSTANLDDLNYLEIYFIQFYNSTVPDGYNVALGGTGSVMTGRKHSEETKLKMSESALGRIFSEETREKMSIAKKGIKLPAEHVKNLSKARIGLSKAGRAIICNETGEEFKSVTAASKQTSVYRTKIYRQLSGQVKNTKCPFTFSYIKEGGAQSHK